MSDIRIGGLIDDNLICPCGSRYLHQEDVEVFASEREDSEHVIVTAIEPDGTLYRQRMDRSKSLNPSARRDGLRVCFSCEECGKKRGLTIVQHKGETLLRWERPAE